MFRYWLGNCSTLPRIEGTLFCIYASIKSFITILRVLYYPGWVGSFIVQWILVFEMFLHLKHFAICTHPWHIILYIHKCTGVYTLYYKWNFMNIKIVKWIFNCLYIFRYMILVQGVCFALYVRFNWVWKLFS